MYIQIQVAAVSGGLFHSTIVEAQLASKLTKGKNALEEEVCPNQPAFFINNVNFTAVRLNKGPTATFNNDF